MNRRGSSGDGQYSCEKKLYVLRREEAEVCAAADCSRANGR